MQCKNALHMQCKNAPVNSVKTHCKNRYVIEIKGIIIVLDLEGWKMLMWSGFYIRRFDSLSPDVFLLYNKTYKALCGYLCNPVSIGESKMQRELLIIHFKLDCIILARVFRSRRIVPGQFLPSL